MMDAPHSGPAVRVGAFGPPEIVDAIQRVLGLALPGSFAVDGRLFVLQPAVGEEPLDALLLVIPAEEGVTGAVRDRLRISPRPVVVFLDGCDRVPEAQVSILDRIESELRGVASDLGLDGESLPVLRGSVRQALLPEPAEPWSEPIRALVAALAARTPRTGGPRPDFRLSIRDLVPVRHGTVVLGWIESGQVRASDQIEAEGGRGRTVHVRGVLRDGDLVSEGREGEEVGLFLEKVRMTDFLGVRSLVRRQRSSDRWTES